MSVVKNLQDSNPENWITAGCPLPTMMGVERRKGKDVPVITKALTELNGKNFIAYERARNLWKEYDCYVSPGPVQFKGVHHDKVAFLVNEPEADFFLNQAKSIAEFENKMSKVAEKPYASLSSYHLGELGKHLSKKFAPIPEFLENGDFMLTAVKQYHPEKMEQKLALEHSLPALIKTDNSNTFV
jgi:hypothetical protein